MTNLLDNGAFLGNLDEWTGTGSILRSDGYPRLGCVQLVVGQSIAQGEDVGSDQLCTLHYFYKLASGGTLTAGYGSVTQTHSGAPTNVWREGVLPFALDANASDNVAFSATGATAYVDTVTLLIGGLALSRGDVATRVARRLATLATDQSLTTVASAKGPEGDYSDAIDEALRQMGACTRYGDPDITRVEPGQVSSLIDAAVTAMLQQLRATYSLKADVALGPRRESLSQVAGSIDAMLGQGPGPVIVRRLTHPGDDP